MHCRKKTGVRITTKSFYRFRYRDNRCGRKESSDAVPTATWSDANAAQRRISAMSVGARYNWPTAGVCAAFHPRIDFTPSLCPSSTPPLCNNNHQPTNQPYPTLSYPILSSTPRLATKLLALSNLLLHFARAYGGARAHTLLAHTRAHPSRTRSTRARRNKERTRNERASGSGWGGRGDTQRKVTRFTGNARKPREREEGRREEEREEGRESSGDG